jgi:hypothetical protein
MKVRVAAVLVVLGLLATTAEARHYDRYRHKEVYREGFLIGFSVGAGDLAPDPCRDCGVGLGLDLHAGGMAGREVAFMFELSGMGRGELGHGFAGPVVQWWPEPQSRLWFKGGLGVGSLAGEDDRGRRQRERPYASVLGATGVELIRSGTFTMDLQLRGIATQEPREWARSVSVSVGFNWY